MDELQIIAGCKQHKQDAQRALYNLYAPKMYVVCLRYMADVESAKDLLHDGFIKIFSSIEYFKEKGSFEGWIRRIFVNMALETIRKQKHLFINGDNIDNISDVGNDDDIQYLYNSISEAELLKMIQQLPKGYSTIFNMYAIEEYSHKEIAALLGISEGTSRSQYIRARRLLQEKVKKYLEANN